MPTSPDATIPLQTQASMGASRIIGGVLFAFFLFPLLLATTSVSMSLTGSAVVIVLCLPCFALMFARKTLSVSSSGFVIRTRLFVRYKEQRINRDSLSAIRCEFGRDLSYEVACAKAAFAGKPAPDSKPVQSNNFSLFLLSSDAKQKTALEQWPLHPFYSWYVGDVSEQKKAEYAFEAQTALEQLAQACGLEVEMDDASREWLASAKAPEQEN